MVRARYGVYGDVQGVAFRAFTRDAARQAGVDGYVRNRTDGSVEVEMAGEPAAVDRVLAAVRRGPPAARVVEVREETPGRDSLPRPFSITY